MLKNNSFSLARLYSQLGRKMPDIHVFFVPEGMKVTGDIDGECKGRIDGAFNGKIHISDKLIIGKTGFINGYIFASEIMVFGAIEGEIYCKGKVSIMNGAVINGDVYANNFLVEEKSVVDGSLKKQNIDELAKIFAAKYKHLGINTQYDHESVQDGELLLSVPHTIKPIPNSVTETESSKPIANTSAAKFQRVNSRWF